MNSLSCFILLLAVVLCSAAEPEYYEFIDRDGECWRCFPTYPCERCIRSYPKVSELWNPNCPVPNCNDRNLRHILFPSRDSNYFFQCNFYDNHWMADRIECQCGLLFSFEKQNCVAVHKWTPFCLQINVPIVVNDCETGEQKLIGTHDQRIDPFDDDVKYF